MAEQLKDIERDILRLALQGLQAKEIAREIGRSHRTVEFYRYQIYKKTGAKNMVELTRELVKRAVTKNARHDIGSGISVCNAGELLEDVHNLERLA